MEKEKTKEAEDLFEDLKQKMRLLYVSDLRRCNSYSICKALRKLDTERYGVEQWLDLYQYLSHVKFDSGRQDSTTRKIYLQLIKNLAAE
ncbi:MAG: hypothetical protein EOM40_07135 [Clostridia bacterium]|nr:hypothetical protein [Clostridia bacterium]NCC42336.1 hypothetical protein [Clostridia bacterium]